MQQELDTLLRAARRRWMRNRSAVGALRGATVAAVLATGLMAAAMIEARWGWFPPVPLYLMPVAAIAVGVLVGAVWPWFSCPSLVQTAIRLERIAGLQEQLSTAAEAIGRGAGKPLTAMEEAVAAQALGLWAVHRLGAVPLAPVPRKLIAACALAAGMCLLTALMPPAHPREGLAVALCRLSAAQRARAAEQLRAEAAGDPRRLEALSQLADALQAGDDEQAGQIIDGLNDKGFAAVAQLAHTSAQPSIAAQADRRYLPPAGPPRDASPPAARGGESHGQSAGPFAAGPSMHSTEAGAGRGSSAPGASKAAAATQPAGGADVSPEYRRTIRRYFSPQ